ncbi:flagellar hook-basal body complex protein FliE [Gracilibacillus halotolerans]|uniref:Flagellar hook-basal body complex protein FliE n=1 Tax=Gracilibacillus halotolerans TaxID=74386 RepID=A0A841RJR6_9BACI|nr:flagellar hook-basal body complex protein FliE [Gracilibacillus halotolerans]MBB6511435.1 flagellar hook-basal body complex protein FliE [Gracilibacillus halotolerans]
MVQTNFIQPLTTLKPVNQIHKTNDLQQKAPTQEFASTLKNAIETLNASQVESDKKTEGLATGKITDLHDVTITAQKASIMLDTAVQIQRKALDAYNEVMRMQV